MNENMNDMHHIADALIAKAKREAEQLIEVERLLKVRGCFEPGFWTRTASALPSLATPEEELSERYIVAYAQGVEALAALANSQDAGHYRVDAARGLIDIATMPGGNNQAVAERAELALVGLGNSPKFPEVRRVIQMEYADKKSELRSAMEDIRRFLSGQPIREVGYLKKAGKSVGFFLVDPAAGITWRGWTSPTGDAFFVSARKEEVAMEARYRSEKASVMIDNKKVSVTMRPDGINGGLYGERRYDIKVEPG